MKKLILSSALVLFTGCATQPEPRVVVSGDKAFLVLGDSCHNPVYVSDDFISCVDDDGEPNGYIETLSSEEYAAWRRQEAQRAQRAAANRQAWRDLANKVSEASDKINAQNQQMLNQTGQYSAPIGVQPLGGPGGITYTQVGGALIGSNGISYQLVGEGTVLGSDGTSCRIVGSVIICN